jgi:hypothetical protein
MIEQSRRQYTRKTLNPLPYINLPSGNGGLVLDISEQGLRFRAIAPVEKSGPIPFSFKSDSNLIAGTGELVWFDETKKTGGLRFTQLPYEALEQIRKWPENSNLRPDISKDLTLHIPAPEGPRPAFANLRRTLAAFAAEIVTVFDELVPESFRSKVRNSWLSVARPASAKMRALASRPHFQKHDRWLFKSAYALVLIIVISTFVYARHRQAGELLIRLGTKLSGGVTTATTASTASSRSPSVDLESTDRSKGSAPTAQPIPQPVSDIPATIAPEISAGPNAPRIRETIARAPKPQPTSARLVVQVAAVKAEADARELTNKLRQENFEAFVGTLPVDSLYRVMLGPYADEASARTVLDKLKKAGFNSFIRRDSGAERLGS